MNKTKTWIKRVDGVRQRYNTGREEVRKRSSCSKSDPLALNADFGDAPKRGITTEGIAHETVEAMQRSGFEGNDEPAIRITVNDLINYHIQEKDLTEAQAEQISQEEMVKRVKKMMGGSYGSLVKLKDAKPTIGTVQGEGRYIGTEIEKNGKWNDNYYTKDGFWVIHEGKEHHVYKVDTNPEFIKEQKWDKRMKIYDRAINKMNKGENFDKELSELSSHPQTGGTTKEEAEKLLFEGTKKQTLGYQRKTLTKEEADSLFKAGGTKIMPRFKVTDDFGRVTIVEAKDNADAMDKGAHELKTTNIKVEKAKPKNVMSEFGIERVAVRKRSFGSFDVFVRTWWRRNPKWPEGREPGAGRKTYIARNVSSESEARRIAEQYNSTHNPGFLSRKAEYES